MNQLHGIQWYFMAFHTKWKRPTFMWAPMTLWQHDPKNCSTACGEINSWSKFYNSWRTEAQLDCRLKAQRLFFTVNILLRKKKKSFGSWNHTSSRQQIKLLFFQGEQRIDVKQTYSVILYICSLTNVCCMYTVTWVSFVFMLLRKQTSVPNIWLQRHSSS